MHYTHDEAERLAYLAGDTERAELHDLCGAGESYGNVLDWEDPEAIKDRLERAEGECVELERENDELRAEVEELRAERSSREVVTYSLQDIRKGTGWRKGQRFQAVEGE